MLIFIRLFIGCMLLRVFYLAVSKLHLGITTKGVLTCFERCFNLFFKVF